MIAAHHPDACVVVPMYNEVSRVGAVVSELRAHFPIVVCIDDGSHDESAEVAERAGAVVVRHPLNRGQGAALQTGFDFVRTMTDAEFVVTFDADGQHQASDASAMVERARREGIDVVLGTRGQVRPDGQPTSRRLLLRAALFFSKLSTGLELTDTHNGLRVLRRSALRDIRLRHRGMAYASELEMHISRSGLTWAEQPVTIVYSDYSRAKGQRNINAANIMLDLLFARLESR